MAKLEALTSAYLIARVERDDARKAATSARGRAEAMVDKNARHGAEVARAERESYGEKFVTNAAVQVRGTGSGVRVIYSRCTHDNPADCTHDARSSPWSEDQIADAYTAADAAAEVAVAAAADFRALEAESSFNVADAATAEGARFAWWPDQRFVDPRRYRYRGQPVTAEEIDLIGPFELRRLINSGGVVEVMG